MEFSDDIKKLIKDELGDKDIYSMSLEELKMFRREVEDKRHEYSLLEYAYKTLGNAGYGSCANVWFYFYLTALAADITAECRQLTQRFWNGWPVYFHETIWNDKELQRKFDFELDESKHDWYRKQQICPYSDTDSVYLTFGTLFDAMTPECQKKYDTPEKRREWILNFCKNHMNIQNKQWCDEIYNPRHGNSIHNFELETIQLSSIFIAKKNNIKEIIWNKGKMIPCDNPKISATGIEIVKSTTPPFARSIQKELIEMLLHDYNPENKTDFMIMFNQRVSELRKKFYNADVEQISQSIGIGDYEKYIDDDTNTFKLAPRCPPGIHAIGRFNYLAHLNNEDNKKVYSGKIKYYNIYINDKTTGYFGFPLGELPSWAPPIDKQTQWRKTVIDPINRFMTALGLPLLNTNGVQQLSLFSFN